eukprot:CAMPEP_0168470368 /NCGR_PEP_ID=MMETSP0228-20121227/58694_1 /TAXON_ID=133427 /ORGANISM="Protoceratium reticulatum, Strain CCCM 535 (=CCMP 1889)" /LENGTH=133 /DNA_ID=CAMNT_0008486171 /DNA_START=98 /DNA_END=496 /DNA_ORIENTATION=-
MAGPRHTRPRAPVALPEQQAGKTDLRATGLRPTCAVVAGVRVPWAGCGGSLSHGPLPLQRERGQKARGGGGGNSAAASGVRPTRSRGPLQPQPSRAQRLWPAAPARTRSLGALRTSGPRGALTAPGCIGVRGP